MDLVWMRSKLGQERCHHSWIKEPKHQALKLTQEVTTLPFDRLSFCLIALMLFHNPLLALLHPKKYFPVFMLIAFASCSSSTPTRFHRGFNSAETPCSLAATMDFQDELVSSEEVRTCCFITATGQH